MVERHSGRAATPDPRELEPAYIRYVAEGFCGVAVRAPPCLAIEVAKSRPPKNRLKHPPPLAGAASDRQLKAVKAFSVPRDGNA